MAIENIDHYLLQVADMAATRDWYVRVIGLREGPHPDFKFPVCWLYANGKDVLHIADGGANTSDNRKKYLGQQSDDTAGSGVIDHVAFRASGLADMIAHLDAQDVTYTKRRVDDQASFQLFLDGPDGVKIELNFNCAEADGVDADVLASDLPDDGG
jgi:catechol 2,3-dioxygenase-like lactoylglutathione lyase family enzyme